MPDVAFVLAPGTGRLRDLADALRRELERQGMPTSAHERFPAPDPGRLYVLVDPGAFLVAAGARALPPKSILDRTLALTAQGTLGAPDASQALLRRMGRVFDISPGAVAELHRDGIPARLLRPGHCVEWESPELDGERDIDIAFYDIDDPRRMDVLSEAAEVLARHRASIHPVHASEMDADRRRAVFRRSKIALALHSGLGENLDWLQAMDAMHSGAVLLTEHSSDLGPFDVGRHLFVASAESLPWVADHLLRDHGRLERTRHEAIERLRAWLPFAVFVGTLRAALIEMLGRPLDTFEDDEENDDLDPSPEDRSSAEAAVLAEMRRTRLDLLDVRRTLTHLQASVANPASGRDRVTVEHNQSWEACGRRAVAVLLTLGADPDAALKTLESLVEPCEHDGELVIVWAAEVISGVRDWLDARPAIPVAQVRDAPGLAGARNAGLECVRAQLCLVLDAGVTLFPRCAGELIRAVDGDGERLGFSYAMQAVRQRAEEPGGDRVPALRGLAGEFTAPLLARAAVLRDAGGFVSQAIGDGVENDELWRRIARPHRLVPEILSRARASASDAQLGPSFVGGPATGARVA